MSIRRANEDTMKLLLTSGGVTNPSIHSALVHLLGKPIDECQALCVPTAQWGHPWCGPASVRGFVAAEPKRDWQYMSGLGWASLGVLELTALPTIGAERWAAGIGVPAYAIDEQTAIKVVDGSVEVISEGQWRKFGS